MILVRLTSRNKFIDININRRLLQEPSRILVKTTFQAKPLICFFLNDNHYISFFFHSGHRSHPSDGIENELQASKIAYGFLAVKNQQQKKICHL